MVSDCRLEQEKLAKERERRGRGPRRSAGRRRSEGEGLILLITAEMRTILEDKGHVWDQDRQRRNYPN